MLFHLFLLEIFGKDRSIGPVLFWPRISAVTSWLIYKINIENS